MSALHIFIHLLLNQTLMICISDKTSSADSDSSGSLVVPLELPRKRLLKLNNAVDSALFDTSAMTAKHEQQFTQNHERPFIRHCFERDFELGRMQAPSAL
jgi:hypothetical protein